ncbi:MAG: TadE family protein [Candidatus Dormiibacterota bacterium]
MRRTSQRGQSLVEFALLVPVLVFVFLGTWTGAALIANSDSVAQATSYGAQIAASVGNVGCTGASCTTAYSCQQAPNDPCAADQEILAAMQPTLQHQLSNTEVIEIDIYRPKGCASLNPSPSMTPPPCPANPNGALQLTLGDTNSSDVGCSTGACVDEYRYCAASGSWDLVDGLPATSRSGSGSCVTGGIAPYTLDLRVQTHPSEAAVGISITFKFTSPGLPFFTQTDSRYTAISFPPSET